MGEAHYTHGWLPAVLPADARRFRVADATLAEALASVGAEIVDEGAEVEIAADPDEIRGDAPLALVTIDPPETDMSGARHRTWLDWPGGAPLRRAVRRLATSLRSRRRARQAERVLHDRGYQASVFLWDVRQRADFGLLSIHGPSIAERLPQRAIAVGRRGGARTTALEAALAEAGRAAGEELRPDWVSIRVGTVVVAAGPAVLRVAVGAARSQILAQIAALEPLARADAPAAVADRLPTLIAHGHAGLADWSLERRLPGARPHPPLAEELLDECFEFLVGLRTSGGSSGTPRTFSELVDVLASVARPETEAVLRALADELERTLAGVERGFAHGDFFAGNLLAEDGHLTAVLDWDAGGPGRVPALDLLHLQLTQERYGRDDQWGRAVVERLLPSARTGGKPLLQRYCAELGIVTEPRLLEALVFAYWLEYAAYQLRTHLDRRSQPLWIEGNVELVARAAAEFTRGEHGRGGRAAPMRKA